MKRLFLTLVALTLLVGSDMLAQTQSQAPTTLQGWADRLQKFGTSIPQEQVFIHMDNTCYFLGDTIYYKAYVRRSDTGAPSRVSGVLYAELLNQDGYLVQRQQLELKNGQVHGSFALLDTLYGGYYELRAYTRWQLNWGITEHAHSISAEQWFYNKRMAEEYYTDYDKLYSRVFPVFDKPKEPGDFYHEMTLRPLRRHAKVDESSSELAIQLFPEGGHLVGGVKNRVAFEVSSNEGYHQEGNIVVTDASGATVAQAGTERRGRGSIEFVPQAGGKYTATFTGKKGTAKAKLPDVEQDGCAVQFSRSGDAYKVDVAVAGSVAAEKLGMTVMHDGVMLDFQELPSGATSSITLDQSKLKTGVCQVTIFNQDGKIYADRLFFCRKNDFKASNLTFTGLTSQAVEPFSPVEMGVEGGEAGSTISLAVRDAAHTEYIYDDGNILTEMLLSSQIRGFVENPAFYFEADDDVHQRALDLLLMIQGWRRYDWHTMATPGAFVLNHKPEQTPLFIGEVNKYQAGEQESNYDGNFASLDGGDEGVTDRVATDDMSSSTEDASATVNADDAGSVTAARQITKTTGNDIDLANDRTSRFNKNEGGLKREVLIHASFNKPGADKAVNGEMMTEKHMFSIPSPRFYEGAFFHLAASDSTKWKGKTHVWSAPATDRNDRLNYPEFYVRLRPYFPRFVKPYDWYQCHLAPAPKGSAMAQDWMMDGSRTLDEITVGVSRNRMTKFDASKPAYVIDAYEAFNATCDAGFCTGIFYGGNRFARDIARTYIGDMNIARDYDLQLRFDTQSQSTQTEYQQQRVKIGGDHDMPVETFNISSNTKEKYNLLKNLGKVYIYTDYSPRREGNSLYDGEDIPTVTVDLRLIDQTGTMRETFRDRRWVLPGYSAPDDFYQPNYSKKPLPDTKDYRRTLYWNPDLQLDANGQAKVTFYNNSKQTRMAVSAEGMANDGVLMTGASLPENRK